jgi:hypothetical protein
LTQKYARPLSVDPKNLGNLPPDQQALLGCGDRFGSGCGLEQADELRAAGVLDTPAGGIDFMNADADVLTQDWVLPKGLTQGTLVGHRGTGEGSYFEAGVSRPGGLTPRDAIQLEGSGPPGSANAAVGGLSEVAYDFQIEPFVWDPDPGLLAQGVLLFDPRRPNPLGENCTPVGPEAGASTCTDLERFSSNLERIFINYEITGTDDVFDPPESMQELMAILDGDPSNDLTGDPLSGPDGIFWGNADTTGDGLRETKAVRTETLPTLGNDVNGDGFFNQHDAVAGDACTQALCYQQVGSAMASTGELPAGDDPSRYLDAKPIFVLVRDEDKGLPPFILGTDHLAFHALSATEQQKLLTADPTQFDPNDPTTFFAYDIDLDGSDDRITLDNAIRDELLTQDLDWNAFSDLDEDRDGKFDWVDDFTPGPISDDNILCGSGIPAAGDPLQDALQSEFYDKSETAAVASLFPTFGGLPPRTPSLCVELVALLSLTGESAPGRRDFWWHRSDLDNDRVADSMDNCPKASNGPSWPEIPGVGYQIDTDGNGIGDACQCGDIDGDGFTNITDALKLARGLVRSGDPNFDKCDVNGDGFCNITDALLIARGQVSSRREDQHCPAYHGP